MRHLLLLTAWAPACAPGPIESDPPTESAPVTEVDVVAAPTELPVTAATDLRRSVGKSVSVRARDLVLLTAGAEIRVTYLTGTLLPVGDYVDLADPASFSVRVDALELRIPEQFFASSMRDKAKGSPLNDLEVRTEGDAFVLEGHARFLNLPFTFRADPMITDSGALGLALEKVRVLGIGLKGFLGAFDRPVENAVNERQHFLEVERDYLVIDPFPFIGPPRVKAAFTSVSVEERALVARLGEAPKPDPSLQGVRLSGGVIRSGSNMFFDTTLTLVATGGGPLTLDPERLNRQIEAGFSKQIGEKRRITLHLASLADLAE